ncbi:Na+/H+ antiporter subunit A [Desulfitobacterium sp. PCE1]|uniref:Na+/H+ antiporter subunit A n=1 Tax=Desulfitobacterium sp. PCE1 TaxID=146907 RepID=UPI00036AFA51|nr:Na+/H+ antiporter subunit A [Desulfitobacterium sp. PCE1]
MVWLYLVLGIPFLFSPIVPLLHKKFTPKIHTGWFVLWIPLLIFFVFLSTIPTLSSGEIIALSLPWIPSYDINITLLIDGLSLIFGLLISGVGFLVILYSIYYLSKHKEALHNFYIYLLLFMGAMLGVVLSDNIFTLYVFWEMTSISSFLLIAYWFEREKSRSGARKSLLITVFGGLAMLAGFILLAMMTDTHSIREMIHSLGEIHSHSLFLPAMVLILIGAFTKSAQFPFSIWLPDAMEAPTPVSAYLHSATMVKAGIYLVARLTPVFGGGEVWFWLVSGIGLVTLLYGSFNAIRQTDLKALLAYSTISQLGLIMSLLGLGSAALALDAGNAKTAYALAIFTALFHLVNHSTFKGCLFMVVGIIDHETGTRDIRKLGGLMHIMPISFTLALIGSLSMAGLPPFNGFLSKELFFTAVLNASEISLLIPVLAWIASILTFVYCMIMVFRTFTGQPKHKLGKQAHEAPLGMLIPPIVLAALVVILFFFPNVLVQYVLAPAWAAVLPPLAQEGLLTVHVSPWHGVTPELLMTLGVIVFGLILYKTLKKWQKLYRTYPQALTLNHIYETSLERMESLSLSLTKRYMTGSLRDYLIYILTFIIVAVGGAMVFSKGIVFDPSLDASFSIYELALLAAMVISAVTVLLAQTRLTSVVAVGSLGFLVVFFFVLFRAPDLALTQLVVETITTVLFLLCFYHLPKLKKENTPLPTKVVNGLVSLAIGIVMTMVALSANGNPLPESISGYYENAYELAGAKNIVNAILVDFRGFDTMLEILVLSMAGLGVYTLIKLRMAGGKENERS